MRERYGNRRVTRMYADIQRLREAIRAEGTEAIQAAWDAVEEHIDFVYSRAPVAADPALRTEARGEHG